MAIPSQMRKRFRERANDHCEYCGLSQRGQEATFHVDHIIPVTSGGSTETSNLALACVSCSLRKGAREFAEDPESRELSRLYHPRRDRWSDHFEWHGLLAIGRTSIGRATVAALQMNRSLILAIRQEEAYWNRHPHVREP